MTTYKIDRNRTDRIAARKARITDTCWGCEGSGRSAYKSRFQGEVNEVCAECDGTGLKGMTPVQVAWWREQSDLLSRNYTAFFSEEFDGEIVDPVAYARSKSQIDAAVAKLGLTLQPIQLDAETEEFIVKMETLEGRRSNRREKKLAALELVEYRRRLFAIAHKMSETANDKRD